MVQVSVGGAQVGHIVVRPRLAREASDDLGERSGIWVGLGLRHGMVLSMRSQRLANAMSLSVQAQSLWASNVLTVSGSVMLGLQWGWVDLAACPALGWQAGIDDMGGVWVDSLAACWASLAKLALD